MYERAIIKCKKKNPFYFGQIKIKEYYIYVRTNSKHNM